jgi:hypothetical protein
MQPGGIRLLGASSVSRALRVSRAHPVEPNQLSDRLSKRLSVGGITVPVMAKWEYATVPLLVHATKQILDTWGEDGWELVQVIPGPNNPEQLVAYFKREKQA